MLVVFLGVNAFNGNKFTFKRKNRLYLQIFISLCSNRFVWLKPFNKNVKTPLAKVLLLFTTLKLEFLLHLPLSYF